MTAARIIWSARAAGQLEAIVGFIAAGSPAEARRFAARVLRRVESLAAHPALGSWITEDEGRTYRELLQGSYRIIYRATDAAVFIVTVRHAARLLATDDLD
jgi:toxin ParE1/3/4